MNVLLTNNCFPINPNKCNVRFSPVIFDYNVDNNISNRLNDIKDLFDLKLSLINHIQELLSYAFRILGLILRNCVVLFTHLGQATIVGI